MSQIDYSTNALINNSLYLIGELAVGEIPDAFMLSSGLEIINELINKFAADSIYIPFLTTLDFVMVEGQATYSIGNDPDSDIVGDRIVDLSFANYTVQTIEYPIRIINKATYYNIVRLSPPQLQARPGFCFLDKQATTSYVTFYPSPDQPYPCSLKAKVMVDQLDEHELLTELPPFYYGFMKYALARKFRSYYPSSNWPDTAEEEYQNYLSILKNANETDLTIRPSGILNAPEPFYWPNILAY